MANTILLGVGAVIPIAWGAAHLLAAAPAVKGFGDISQDSRRIITMEWIMEGLLLIFIGAVVLAATVIDRSGTTSRWVFRLSFLILNIMSAVSLFTGFRVRFLPYRLCPILFTAASILIILGTYL
jgi:hypothetical protein